MDADEKTHVKGMFREIFLKFGDVNASQCETSHLGSRFWSVTCLVRPL